MDATQTDLHTTIKGLLLDADAVVLDGIFDDGTTKIVAIVDRMTVAVRGEDDRAPFMRRRVVELLS